MAQTVDADDIFSDANDTLEDGQYADAPRDIERVEAVEANIAVQNVKIATEDQAKDDISPVNESPIHESDRGVSIPSNQDLSSDAASVRSLPTANVTEPDPLSRRPSTARTAESSQIANRAPPPSPSRSHTPQEDGSQSQQQRRALYRSAVELRTSNRLSGFFSNLIHRRDNLGSASSRNTNRDDPPFSAPGQSSESYSRSSSPVPGRSVTPPPRLPPPTLHELGLSLSVLTSDLSPSHFSTPPSSGAFMAPHYLLLCHAQGLDVLPLVSPPAPQPYALVRRVSFKSVVVMEQRGVLVAIAGRRDGVRVYALEEVKKAIEWRIDSEVRRERDRLRRETVKKIVMSGLDVSSDPRNSAEKTRKPSLSTPPPTDPVNRDNLHRKGSYSLIPMPPSTITPPAPLVPRSPTPRPPRRPKTPQLQIPAQIPEPSERPPPYSSPLDLTHPPRLLRPSSVISFNARSRSGSVSNVLAGAPVSRRNTNTNGPRDPDSKTDWVESSDDEAIDIVAAGSSGSQALDERTSVRLSASLSASPPIPVVPVHTTPPPRSLATATRRNRPSNLDLTLSRSGAPVPPPEPSPAPTLLTLRQALSHSPPTLRDAHAPEVIEDPDTPFDVGDEDDNDVDGRISLAQALLESRIPDLPPVGTRRPQQPILLSSSHIVATGEDRPSSPRTSDGHTVLSHQSNIDRSQRRRRRWSVMLGSPPSAGANGLSTPYQSPPITPSTAPLARERTPRSSRSHSLRSSNSTARLPSESPSSATAIGGSSIISPQSSRSSRFIPRLISNAFYNRRADDRPPLPEQKINESDGSKKVAAAALTPHTPPPKLEYVKLPGTKGALAVKAVETAKKSFLAILCGENGEKVELFAGTYRTALGLSRTFILPDSPRSLELQLQGDDLVEVFLVFSQNVFGLEPATVRVREVRIGRAERRAARRRARGVRSGDGPINDSEAALAEEDTGVNVNIGVSVAVGSTIVATGDGPDRSQTPPLIPNEHPGAHSDSMLNGTSNASTGTQSEELVTSAVAHMGPYTTFQQLNFAPKFPLASIADEYIIPPTYPDFLEYRAEYETEERNELDLTQIQFSPPGLPIPVPTAPSRWYYLDPKNVVHGPWKASLMQTWYKDGLLPPDLPVRQEESDAYVLLKDLRLQCVDPAQPFRCPPPPAPPIPPTVAEFYESEKPLLAPISLLSQPRHFGPPALFFSSRGGHSTAIVDARGRSVLKGRFLWSTDEQDEDSKPLQMGRMGDVKRLEAFDVQDRAILVAMRQGGLEALDLCDALLKPADESRTVLPQFSPPPSNINRRAPFVWKIGTPVSASPASATILSSKGKGGHGHVPGKKQSTGSAKSPASRSEFSPGDMESDVHDEVLFLGRKDDEIYFCERNTGSFRILRLCPNAL